MNFSPFIQWLLYSSATAAVLTLVVLVVKRLGKSILGPKGHYYIWFLIIIRLLLPYSFESPASMFNLYTAVEERINLDNEEVINQKSGFKDYEISDTGLEQDKSTLQPITSDVPKESNYEKPDSTDIHTGMSISSLLNRLENLSTDSIMIFIWLLGAFITGIFILSRDINFWISIKKCSPQDTPNLNRIIAECRSIVGLRKQVTLVLTEAIAVPVVYGILKPKLLLPENMYEKLSEEELKYIVLHELSHLKRRDIQVNCIITMLKIVHWFNPILFFAFSRMKYDREVACDALAMSHLQSDEYKEYGLTMIHLLRNLAQKSANITPAAGILNKKSHMKGRIIMISKFKKNSYKWSALALAIIIAVGAVGLTAPVKATTKEAADKGDSTKNVVTASTSTNANEATTGKNQDMGKIINIPDKKLAECIARDSGIPLNSVIREGDAKKLKELKLLGVSNLEGIQYCTNVENINFEGCKVRDITLLSKLPNLKNLIIAYNDVNPDLTPIKDLKRIESLRLDNVQDFKPISELKTLKSLDVVNMGSGVTNLEDLKSCVRLESLSLRELSKNKNFNDISALSSLTNLKHLDISFPCADNFDAQLIDLIPIKSLKNLETLDVYGIGYMDSSVLKSLTKLERLSLVVFSKKAVKFDLNSISSLTELKELLLDHFDIGNLKPLSGMPQLRDLCISSCKIKDINQLSKLNNLKRLSLSSLQLTDISALAGMKHLQSLSLRDNKIQDITPLAGLSSLESLYIDSSSISDISPLKSLTNLKTLLLLRNKISDLTPLAGMKKLKKLSLGDNNISDLSPISELLSLDELNLMSNKITDVTSLKSLTSLRYLSLGKNKITDITPLKSLTGLVNLSLGNNKITDISPLSGLTELQVLGLTENNISNIKPLTGLTNLSALYLTGNKITDYSPVAQYYKNIQFRDFKLNLNPTK